MRIIGGEARGRVLQTREGKGTRPTDSRTREMLFNILEPQLEDCRFLDLYAGSGAVGMEALSRGAAYAAFVELNAVAISCIRTNLRTFGWEDKAQVWQANVRMAMRKFIENEERFDIVFADPPFTDLAEMNDFCTRMDKAPELLHNVGGQARGLFILQHHRKFQPKIELNFELARQKGAGESVITFFHPRQQKGREISL